MPPPARSASSNDILTERDAASLLVFNHDLERLTPFTGDTRQLRYAAEGLRAWGSTRLYDGIAYAVSPPSPGGRTGGLSSS